MQRVQKVIRVQPLANRGGAGKGKAMRMEIVGECFFLFIASSQGQTGFHGLPRPCTYRQKRDYLKIPAKDFELEVGSTTVCTNRLTPEEYVNSDTDDQPTPYERATLTAIFSKTLSLAPIATV